MLPMLSLMPKIRLAPHWCHYFAWSGLGAAFGPVILCMLYDRRTNLAGAVAGMACDFAMTVIWVLEYKVKTWKLYEMIPGFFIGLAVTLGVSRLQRKLESTA